MTLIAKKAKAKNTGARGLRAILESILTEAMYEVDTYQVIDHGYHNCTIMVYIYIYIGVRVVCKA